VCRRQHLQKNVRSISDKSTNISRPTRAQQLHLSVYKVPVTITYNRPERLGKTPPQKQTQTQTQTAHITQRKEENPIRPKQANASPITAISLPAASPAHSVPIHVPVVAAPSTSTSRNLKQTHPLVLLTRIFWAAASGVRRA
jgi:hypothetical protein